MKDWGDVQSVIEWIESPVCGDSPPPSLVGLGDGIINLVRGPSSPASRRVAFLNVWKWANAISAWAIFVSSVAIFLRQMVVAIKNTSGDGGFSMLLGVFFLAGGLFLHWMIIRLGESARTSLSTERVKLSDKSVLDVFAWLFLFLAVASFTTGAFDAIRMESWEPMVLGALIAAYAAAPFYLLVQAAKDGEDASGSELLGLLGVLVRIIASSTWIASAIFGVIAAAALLSIAFKVTEAEIIGASQLVLYNGRLAAISAAVPIIVHVLGLLILHCIRSFEVLFDIERNTRAIRKGS